MWRQGSRTLCTTSSGDKEGSGRVPDSTSYLLQAKQNIDGPSVFFRNIDTQLKKKHMIRHGGFDIGRKRYQVVESRPALSAVYL